MHDYTFVLNNTLINWNNCYLVANCVLTELHCTVVLFEEMCMLILLLLSTYTAESQCKA